MSRFTTLVVFALSTAPATADTVRLEFEGIGQGRDVRVTLGLNSFNCFAGQLNHNFSNGNGVAAGLTGNLTAFCSNLRQPVTSYGAAYTVSSLQNPSGGTPMGDGRMQAISDMHAAAGGAQLDTDPDRDAAFQLAIWEVIYDYQEGGSLSLASGQLKVGSNTLNGSMLAPVSRLFGAISSNAAQLGVRKGAFQDQILQIQVVPAPLAGVAGLLGLGLAGYVRRRETR